MGRGQARARRIADYFNRKCLPCAEVHVRASLASYTDTKGELRPTPQDVVDVRLAKLRTTY